MAPAVAVETRDDARILTFRNGPTNALSAPLRAALIAWIEAAGPPWRRILMAADGPAFSSAVPLQPDRQRPTLAELCAAVKAARVPVIAVLSGLVQGAGAELALAAWGRVAAPGMRLAFPEVAFGLCPAAGTTLPLPRLIGSEGALDLLLSGRLIGAEEALTLGGGRG
jgi:3-hydroxyacyl-CoA dehydrogenase